MEILPLTVLRGATEAFKETFKAAHPVGMAHGSVKSHESLNETFKEDVCKIVPI